MKCVFVLEQSPRLLPCLYVATSPIDVVTLVVRKRVTCHSNRARDSDGVISYGCLVPAAAYLTRGGAAVTMMTL
jgi:hypothetical protein